MIEPNIHSITLSRRFSACCWLAEVKVTGAFCSKSSSTFANVKRLNMIRISPKEIGFSLAQHIADFRVAQNGNGKARRPDALRPKMCGI
jgi:hypothetical protein